MQWEILKAESSSKIPVEFTWPGVLSYFLAQVVPLEANHTQEVLSLFFCEVLLCSVVVFFFSFL